MEVVRGPAFGGKGGVPFSDDAFNVMGIHRINIRYGRYVDRLEILYVTDLGPGQITLAHGGNGGTNEMSISLGGSEVVEAVAGRAGAYIDQLTFRTNYCEYGPFGGDGGTPFEFVIPEHSSLAGFFGRAGDFIDQIGFLYAKPW